MLLPGIAKVKQQLPEHHEEWLAKVIPTLGVSGGKDASARDSQSEATATRAPRGMTVGGQETQVPVTQLGYPKP
jgi:hypothetical protein